MTVRFAEDTTVYGMSSWIWTWSRACSGPVFSSWMPLTSGPAASSYRFVDVAAESGIDRVVLAGRPLYTRG